MPCLIYIIQQEYNYVSSGLWPRLTFFELKNTDILKSSGGDWERVSCLFIAIHVGVFPIELLAYQVSMVCDEIWPR